MTTNNGTIVTSIVKSPLMDNPGEQNAEMKGVGSDSGYHEDTGNFAAKSFCVYGADSQAPAVES